jgi:hypothetical protein
MSVKKPGRGLGLERLRFHCGWRKADQKIGTPAVLSAAMVWSIRRILSLAPGVGAEFIGLGAAATRCLRSGGRGVQNRARFGSVEFPRGGGNHRLRAHGLHHFLDLLAVIETDHHHHEFRLLGRDHFPGRLGPVGIFAAGVISHLGADEPGAPVGIAERTQ